MQWHTWGVARSFIITLLQKFTAQFNCESILERRSAFCEVTGKDTGTTSDPQREMAVFVPPYRQLKYDYNRMATLINVRSPFSQNKHHQSNDDCLEVRTVEYCVQQLCTVHCTYLRTDLTIVCWLDLAVLWFYRVLQLISVRFSFLGLFYVTVYSCVCAFVVLDSVSSLLCQEIG